MSSPTDFATAAQALAAAVLAATVDPADGIRLLSSLAAYASETVSGADPIGMAMADMGGASADLFRRAAVVALARASATYQPSSYDDAANVRAGVVALLDQEITTAGDQGEDASYNALRTLRQAVIQDLTTRGASLAPMAGFQFGASLPVLTLATMMYRDPGRSDELVTQVDPIHPAFMPNAFRALASPLASNAAGPGSTNPAGVGRLWDQPGQTWDTGTWDS